jgi:hypothetical protein
VTSTETQTGYDSRPDTLRHSLRVGELIIQLVTGMLGRATKHDLSKTEPPELAAFDEASSQLGEMEYDSDAYRESLERLGVALEHHYQTNRHHPQHWGSAGISGMTLVDVVEMICDWKAATERMKTGDLARSIEIAKTRFGLSDQLAQIFVNTAVEAGWIPAGEGAGS